MKEKMQECMEKCKWCPWVLVIVGIILLILGFIFNAITIKVLWIIISIVAIVAGGFGLYFKYKETHSKPKQE